MGAGSTTPPSSPSETTLEPVHINPSAHHFHPNMLPEFEYPVPFHVRNTFIDTGIRRPLSLEGFFEERRVHSSPVQVPPGLEDDVQPVQIQRSMTTGSTVMASAFAAAAAASAAAAAARCWLQGDPLSSV